MHRGPHFQKLLAGDNGVMHLAIRCHPCAATSAQELERWFDKQVEDLRGRAPHDTVRLSRLTQRLGPVDIQGGWLLEVELRDTDLLRDELVSIIVRDARLLGMQPTVLLALNGLETCARVDDNGMVAARRIGATGGRSSAPAPAGASLDRRLRGIPISTRCDPA